MTAERSSGHRRRQAEATRTVILVAARELFVAPGFTSASIDAIARAAGVGVSTVYAVFASKTGVLDAMRAHWPRDPAALELLREAASEPDAATRLETVAHATRREWERDAVSEAIDAGAAAGAPETSAPWRAHVDARRHARVAVLQGMADRLAAGHTAASAAAIVDTLCARDAYERLIAAGWTPERYETWLATALTRELLG